MSAIYNSLNPAVKTPQPPPPPPPHHESFWDEIISLVVVAVILVVAPHLLGALMFSGVFAAGGLGLAGLSAAQLALVTGIAGALADAASQGVAIAFDDQHGFSIQSMVENAIASGATAGLAKEMGIEKLLNEKNPEYVKAFAESAAIGTTVQVFQMSVGLRDKIDWKIIAVQAASSVISAKINRGFKHINRGFKHISDHMPGIVDHVADESANTAFAFALGTKPDLTALAGNVLADEAADTADLIANHARQSHHPDHPDVTPVGKTSSATQYAEHAHAPHVASRSARESMHADDELTDLYADYQSQLSGDVSAMSEAEFATVMSDTSTSSRHAETQRIQHLERDNSRRSHTGFFERGMHRYIEAGKLQLDFDTSAAESTMQTMSAVNQVATGQFSTNNYLAFIAAVARRNDASMHFLHELIHISTMPAAWRDLKNGVSDDLHGIAHHFENQWRSMTTPNFDADVKAAGRFAPYAAFGAAGLLDSAVVRFAGDAVSSVGRSAVGLFGRGGVEKFSSDFDPGLYHFNPRDIRFTQPNVGPYFSNGTRVGDLIPQLRARAVSPYDLPPIQVVQRNGKLFSIDNRRLLAFNAAGVDRIPVQVVSSQDRAVAYKLGRRFDPILGEGQYAVVVPKSGRAEALSLLEEYGMIKGTTNGY